MLKKLNYNFTIQIPKTLPRSGLATIAIQRKIKPFADRRKVRGNERQQSKIKMKYMED